LYAAENRQVAEAAALAGRRGDNRFEAAPTAPDLLRSGPNGHTASRDGGAGGDSRSKGGHPLNTRSQVIQADLTAGDLRPADPLRAGESSTAPALVAAA